MKASEEKKWRVNMATGVVAAAAIAALTIPDLPWWGGMAAGALWLIAWALKP